RLDRYFDYKGHCYLSVHINYKEDKQTEGLTAQFIDNCEEFGSLQKCQQSWFNKILNEIEYPVVTSELRGLDKFLMETSHKNIKKIAVVHSSHLKAPFNNIKKIKKGSRNLFENESKLNNIIFL